MKTRLLTSGVLLSGALLLAQTTSQAVISRIYPLGKIVESSDWIASGPAKVEAGQGKLTLNLSNLKGTAPAPQTTFTVQPLVSKPLFDRVAPKQGFVLFGSNKGAILGFTNGTWFKAQKAGNDWQIVALSPEMARSWMGSSAALSTLVRDILAGKAKAPDPNPKLKPSLGPVVKSSSSRK